MLFGVWAVDALVSIAPESAPRVSEIRLDPMVFAFAALLTLVTGVLFGLAPALQSSRSEVTHSLKDGGRGSSASAGRMMRRSLIVAEVTLALVLLTGGALLLQTFVRLQRADLGFNPANVLVGAVNPPGTTYDTRAKHLAFYDQVFEKAAALPGVQKAAMASVLPLSGDSDTSFILEGRPAPAHALRNAGHLVSPGQRQLFRHDGNEDPPRPRLRDARGNAGGRRERIDGEEVLSG